ncbi:hypothetical protein ACG873_23655 [Mesorhizobium sp. AaZ16]|uniref:hypothetical protein n=1 Tax=Mesorhizobium sp. AaZ16 TaxID=3402289 RepID=UPI00374E6019
MSETAAMRGWLQTNFLRIGVVALVVDAIARFYAQIGMQWITDVGLGLNLTFDQTLRFAHAVTVLDIAASMLWGLFSLGFACRVLQELTRGKQEQ